MNSDSVIQMITRGKIIAILRGDFRGREVDIAVVLRDAGVTALEVTLNSTDPLGCIKRLATSLGDSMAIGAGTVLTVDHVTQAADAGASFIVSPNRDLSVIKETKRCKLVSIPGCFTPSEIIEAHDAGADAAKLFPAISLGPEFVSAFRGPVPKARLVPTGGVNADLTPQYLKAGAWALGVGSDLVDSQTVTDAGLVTLRERALRYVAAVKGASQ